MLLDNNKVYFLMFVIIISLILISYTDMPSTLLGNSYFANTNKSLPAPGVFANVSGTYILPNIGLNITLPVGWKGIDLMGTVLVSPKGINPTTGVLNPSSDLEKVFLILTHTAIISKAESRPDYYEYLRDGARNIGCKVVSDEFVKLNGFRTEKVVGKCGKLEDTEFLAYAIASNNKSIYVGLKGSIPAFEYNYPIFNQSINTLKVDNQTDIKSWISKSSLQ